MYKGQLPFNGMKTIYFDVCMLGEPSISKIENDIFGSGSHMAYDWMVGGKQIFHADAKYGYVYSTNDYRYKLDEDNNKHKNNSSGSSGGQKNSYSGYSFYADHYDVQHYYNADDFADEWEDDFDSWDDAFDYWEDNY